MPPTPPYYKPVIPNNKRRALWHDYRSRCIYMITVNKSSEAPAFGELINIIDPRKADIRPSLIGKIICEEIDATPAHHPEIRILSRIIMPDHFHALIFVTSPINKHLGEIIQAIKSAATRRVREAVGQPSLIVFEDGFHDRILTRDGQLETIFRYILENPYRLEVRRSRPDFFRLLTVLRLMASVIRPTAISNCSTIPLRRPWRFIGATLRRSASAAVSSCSTPPRAEAS